jgi:hypothetical protein
MCTTVSWSDMDSSIQIDAAARRTLPALEAPSGVMVIAED